MLDAVTSRPTPPLAATVVGGALLAVVLSGCGSGDPRTVDPSGIDGLEVPSPSPDPADFVAVVDNPWLPLAVGSRWRYRVAGGDDRAATATVTVPGVEHEVAGVAVTVVREVVRDVRGEVLEETVGWYAQDDAGNVWLLGEQVAPAQTSWQVGVAGAQAGLAMPAVPRVGDGFEQAHAPGLVEERARVLEVGASVQAPAGSWDDALRTEDTSPREPGRVTHSSYAPGVGLVREQAVAGGTEVVELLSHTTSGTR